MPYHRCPDCGITSYSAALDPAESTCPLCCSAQTNGSRRYLPVQAGRSVKRRLPVRVEAATEARAAVAGLSFPAETLETLKIVVSELVTNSVRHASLSAVDRIELQLATDDDRVWVAVRDDGPGFNLTARHSNGSDPLGLVIVAASSEAWGVQCMGGGCTVWCVVAVPQSGLGRAL